jgi:hypothetical protein
MNQVVVPAPPLGAASGPDNRGWAPPALPELNRVAVEVLTKAPATRRAAYVVQLTF